ncbi:MAG: hypothetical protein DRI24_10665 [Deltaproteobacteria bacterium]|nr:MAG: hypothetical protein DRI24_10665 [Deltaproteobacteria bacterium]
MNLEPIPESLKRNYECSGPIRGEIFKFYSSILVDGLGFSFGLLPNMLQLAFLNQPESYSRLQSGTFCLFFRGFSEQVTFTLGSK